MASVRSPLGSIPYYTVLYYTIIHYTIVLYIMFDNSITDFYKNMILSYLILYGTRSPLGSARAARTAAAAMANQLIEEPLAAFGSLVGIFVGAPCPGAPSL